MATQTLLYTPSEEDGRDQEIRILDFRLLNTGTSLKALATVQYGQTTIQKIKITHRAGNPPYITPPTATSDPNSTEIVHWDAELHSRIERVLLDAYRRAAKGGG